MMLRLVGVNYNNLYIWSLLNFIMKFRENLWPEDVWERIALDIPLKDRKKKDYSFRVPLSKEEEEYSSILVLQGGLVYFYKKFNTNAFAVHVPALLMNSVSEFVGEKKSYLNLSDFIFMQKYLVNLLGKPKLGKSREIKKWRKLNGVSFFGYSQYEFLDKFVEAYTSFD